MSRVGRLEEQIDDLRRRMWHRTSNLSARITRLEDRFSKPPAEDVEGDRHGAQGDPGTGSKFPHETPVPPTFAPGALLECSACQVNAWANWTDDDNRPPCPNTGDGRHTWTETGVGATSGTFAWSDELKIGPGGMRADTMRARNPPPPVRRQWRVKLPDGEEFVDVEGTNIESGFDEMLDAHTVAVTDGNRLVLVVNDCPWWVELTSPSPEQMEPMQSIDISDLPTLDDTQIIYTDVLIDTAPQAMPLEGIVERIADKLAATGRLGRYADDKTVDDIIFALYAWRAARQNHANTVGAPGDWRDRARSHQDVADAHAKVDRLIADWTAPK